MNIDIPKEVLQIAAVLETAGFEAYAVGGAVRDMFLARRTTRGELVEPKDWDVATNATPDKIQELFPDSVYENQFGTVGVKVKKSKVKSQKSKVDSDTEEVETATEIVEVTTYRIEGKYSDNRHPDEVKFAKTIEEDLSRRDFTVNAMALALHADINVLNDVNVVDGKLRKDHLEQAQRSNKRSDPTSSAIELVDPCGGREDLEKGIIRAVGDAGARFEEDALRLLRAVRFAAELDFRIEPETAKAIRERAGLLGTIAKERVRDEFVKMIMTERAADGIFRLEEYGLLGFILPELREGIGVSQDKHHIYGVFEHLVRSLDYAAKEDYSLEVRLASLLHDMGKPKTKRVDKSGATFYNHEMVGAKMAGRALERLHFPKDLIEKVVHLVRYHMFYYNVGEVSPAGVRRFLVRVGVDSIDDLFRVREADRIGSGVPKAVPYKLRHLKFMIDKVRHDPLSPKMLKVNGTDLMTELGIPPGPRLGAVLAALLEEVIDDPEKNEKSMLLKRAKELDALSEEELVGLAKKAKEKQAAVEAEVEEGMKQKHRV